MLETRIKLAQGNDRTNSHQLSQTAFSSQYAKSSIGTFHMLDTEFYLFFFISSPHFLWSNDCDDEDDGDSPNDNIIH